MRKIVSILLCVLLIVFASVAFAEEIAPATTPVQPFPAKTWDWTPVATSLINMISLVAIWLLTAFVRPWLEKHNLYDAAVVAVNSAEAIFGRYHGEDKLRAAIAYMASKGFNTDSEKVIDAVQQAWKNMNFGQIAMGVKKPEEEDTPT